MIHVNFDGLDELHRDLINCIEQSRNIPNDPNNELSAMNLCIKLILGDLLKGATILVTSRPTADNFYSKLDFDRNVEIIGFTSDKIEEYVSRFCKNNEKREHELESHSIVVRTVKLVLHSCQLLYSLCHAL